MFWGLILKPNKKYSQKVAKAFHVSQAALDTTSGGDEFIQVMLNSENNNYVLCTLRKNKTEQVSLDLNFAEGDEIAFTSQGNGSVHLTGYLIPDNDGYFDGFGDEESDVSDTETTPIKKEKPKKKNSNLKEIEEESESDELEMEEDEDGSSDEEEGEEDQEESDSDDDEIEEPKAKQKKIEVIKQNGVEGKKKNKHNKNKIEKLQQTNDEKSNKKSGGTGGEINLPGGLKCEEIRIGTGPEAKPGKKVQVYYEGRLKSNNKIFDSTKQGAGFKFSLGKGEVIRGWDVGVAGMKVGGKRRIVCPPNMAYGNKGSPPVIPPNSTLIFDVELKGVH